MADMVSERYALSLYEVAQDGSRKKLYLDQLTEVCAAFDSEPDFLKMLTTPSIAAEDKQRSSKPCSRDVSSLSAQFPDARNG